MKLKRFSVKTLDFTENDMKVKVIQSCLTLFDLMDCSPPSSYFHQILQARILEWVAMPFSKGSSWPGIEPGSPALQADSFHSEPLRETLHFTEVGHRFALRTLWYLGRACSQCLWDINKNIAHVKHKYSWFWSQIGLLQCPQRMSVVYMFIKHMWCARLYVLCWRRGHNHYVKRV